MENGNKMLLIISICKDKLHELEFVRPIEDILNDENILFNKVHYTKINKKDLEKTDKIIICGTSLQDNDFLKYAGKFDWIKSCNKPILGICGGMHIIGLIFGGKLKKKKQIGLIDVNFKKEFLGIIGEKQVYNLHGLCIDFKKLKEFEIYADSECEQAVKHKQKEIYGVLFHPEVRNKIIIREFSCLKI